MGKISESSLPVQARIQALIYYYYYYYYYYKICIAHKFKRARVRGAAASDSSSLLAGGERGGALHGLGEKKLINLKFKYGAPQPDNSSQRTVNQITSNLGAQRTITGAPYAYFRLQICCSYL